MHIEKKNNITTTKRNGRTGIVKRKKNFDISFRVKKEYEYIGTQHISTCDEE